MLEVTVQALVAMAYPHDTWVLDEGDDARVHALCTRLGARHFSRKSLPHYQTAEGRFQARSKHGNYNAWLAEHGFAHYDVIVNVDPDHVPAPTFLHEVLGYFADPKIGYVQVPQAYYNQEASFVARGAAEETYAYYSVTQMASYGAGLPDRHRLSHHPSHRGPPAGGRVCTARRRRPADHLPLPGGGLAGGVRPEDPGLGADPGGLGRVPEATAPLGALRARH